MRTFTSKFPNVLFVQSLLSHQSGLDGKQREYQSCHKVKIEGVLGYKSLDATRLNSLLTEVGIADANLWKHTVLYHTHDMKHEGYELYVAQIHRIPKMFLHNWDDLIRQLDANGLRDKLQCPFLISLYRSEQEKEEREKAQEADDNWYAKKTDAEHEEWYTKANLKIMFFGREPNWWVRYDEEGEDPADVGSVMAAYEDYLDDNYNVVDAHFYKERIDHRNRFLLFGVNGIMSGIREILKDFPDKRVSLIWNEISKLSKRKGEGGVAVNAFEHNIEKRCFHVIPKEIEILKPDIVVFFTGPKETKYCDYIRENFNIIGEPMTLSGLPIDDVSKLQLEGVKLAYLTHHPGYMPEGKKANDFHWTLYNAILADIKENIDKLLKKE